MRRKEQSQQAPPFNVKVEYAPNPERMLEALMLALGLPKTDIKDMLAARREQKNDGIIRDSTGAS